MKINIYSKGKLAFNPFTEKNVGVGSTETTIVNVAKELAERGHEVIAYVNCNYPDIYDGVRYYKNFDYRPSDKEDVLIGFGNLPTINNADNVFLWSTKVDVSEIKSLPNADDVKNLIVSSDWHRDRLASEIPHEFVKKMTVIEPGVSKEFLELKKDKWPLSVTFAGPTQKGGMEALIQYANRVKPKNKDILIYAMGGASMWGWDDAQFRPLYNKLIRAKIYYQGQKGKRKLMKQLGGSKIFLYPVKKTYQEAFGLGVLEAMAVGCVVITNNSGNLKNLVKDAGYVIDENIEDYKWPIESADLTFKLFDNPALMKEMSDKARKYAKEYTWTKTVDKLLNLVS